MSLIDTSSINGYKIRHKFIQRALQYHRKNYGLEVVSFSFSLPVRINGKIKELGLKIRNKIIRIAKLEIFPSDYLLSFDWSVVDDCCFYAISADEKLRSISTGHIIAGSFMGSNFIVSMNPGFFIRDTDIALVLIYPEQRDGHSLVKVNVFMAEKGKGINSEIIANLKDQAWQKKVVENPKVTDNSELVTSDSH